MAKTADRVPEERPPFTGAELAKAIPPHCMERSNVKSFTYLGIDLVMLATIYYIGSFIPSLPSVVQFVLWPFWGFWAGVIYTSLWVIAHECGHHAFSSSRFICDLVGLPLHTMLLVPYHSWRISHSRHHGHTSDMDLDEVFIPPREDATPEALRNGEVAPARYVTEMIVMYLIGWPAYLFAHVTGRDYKQHTDHFNPTSPIFKKSERNMIILSDVALLVWIGILGVLTYMSSFMWMIKLYWIPYLVCNFFLILYTKLHHTDTALPHFSGSEWTFIRGALATIDRDYGIFNYLHHNIGDTHVAHHLFSTLPHYHAEEATEALKPVLGKYYKKSTDSIIMTALRVARDCRCVTPSDPSNPGNTVWWFA